MIVGDTPIEEYIVKGKTVLVKREDLCATSPLPPLSKLRGAQVLLESLHSRGVRLVGCIDSRYSKSGQGIAAMCKDLGMDCIIGYPSSNRVRFGKVLDKSIPDQLIKAQGLDAQLYPVNPNYIRIIYHQTRNHVVNLGGTMLPFGLTCVESTNAVAEEAATVPKDLLEGTLVICVGTGTILSGVLLGLKSLPRRIIGVSSGISLTNQRLNLRSLLFEANTPLSRMTEAWEKLTILPPIMPYSESDDIDVPFPTHKHYDAKSFHWLTDHIDELWEPIIFWNVGS